MKIISISSSLTLSYSMDLLKSSRFALHCRVYNQGNARIARRSQRLTGKNNS